MARMARVVAVGLPHHITQRGNGRRDIFLTDDLRQTYLDLLRRESAHYELRILAYCLMTNHLHLVAIPGSEQSMSGALRHAHGRFAQYWNTRVQTVGHMWQNRYFSCPMQPARVWSVIRYVELNPVRAGMVRNAADYRWSSAAAHAGGVDDSGVLDMEWWRREWALDGWNQVLRADAQESGGDTIRRATYTGRPIGDIHFVADLEIQLGRELAPKAGGHPRKTGTSKQLHLSAGIG